jgi:lipopolysaccharide biosynthesis protein
MHDANGKEQLKVSIDTTVIHTTAESYKNAPIEQQLSKRAEAKRTKYKDREAADGREFIPFVLTSFGTFHDEAIELLNRIGTIASQNRIMPKEVFVKNTIRRLLNSLHRGNSVLLEYSWQQHQSVTTYTKRKQFVRNAKV